MANRYDIIRIDFQASAKGANAAIESIRKEAEECNNQVSALKAKIAEGVKTGADGKILEGWQTELKVAERRFKQFSTAQKELVKGMRALDEGVKMFNDGSLATMNAAFQKTVNNAAKLAQSKLETGTKEWRQMGALMQETEQNYARMLRDTDQLVESLQNGGTVFRKTLEDEKKGLQDLLQVLPYMGTEYRKAADQLDFLSRKTDEMIVKERQMKGEIVTTDDARRVSYQLTKEGAEAARQRAAAADQEIENGKKTIATLEEEQKIREANARISARAAADYRENQQMHEDEIVRLDKEIKKEQELANSKKNGIEALKRKAIEMADDADAEIKKQQQLDSAYETAKGKVSKLREEVEKLRQSITSAPAKDGAAEAVKASAEAGAESLKAKYEAKEKETQATKESTEAKKNEVKAGKEAAEEGRKEAETAETLKKKHESLVEETKKLIAERDKLTAERDGLVKTLEAEAAAADKAANAFASLSKGEAEAMLKERQAIITKGEDGKFSYTNAENAQHFLIESMRKVSPANAKGDALSLDGEGVAKVRAMFKERYGLQSDDDAKEAIKGLLTGGENSLIKMGVMNNAFARIDIEQSRVTAYSKIIKDLTEVINGEAKAVEGESEAKKRLEQVDTRLLQVKEKIDANDKESKEIFRQRRAMMGSEASSTDSLKEKTDELSESKLKNAEATKAQIEAIKKMSAEEAKAASQAMSKVSTVDYKAGKLDMSNPEEVQAWLITQMRKHGATEGRGGTLSVGGGANIDGILAGFKQRYNLKGDNQKAKELLNKVVQGKGGGGLLREGGMLDFGAETIMIKANTEAFQGRLDKLKALFEITNKASYAAAHSTETTEKETQAVKGATEATKELTAAEQKALEVQRLKEAYDKSKAEYDKMKEHLAGLKAKKKSLPGGTDGELERASLESEINDYDENVKTPKGSEVARLKRQWKKEAAKLAEMEAKATAENATAENRDAEATERNAKAKGTKAKASEGASKATAEETQKSAELIAKEAELKKAEEEETAAKKKAEEQQKKTTKAVNDAKDAETKAGEADKGHAEAMEKLNGERKEHAESLKKLNEANKDTIATNEKNQQLLAETNGKIQEQGEKIRSAERIKAQAQTEGIEKTEQAIRILTEENRRIDQNSFTWRRNTVEIQHLQAALDEMKGKPALMMMEDRMKNVGSLSSAAVTETKRFWEAMVAGAEKGSEKLAHAEAHLKAITEEEKKRSRAADKTQVRTLFGDLSKKGTEDIRAAIEAGRRLIDTYDSGSPAAQRLAQAIVAAEDRLKKYGVEAERAARREAAAVEEAAQRRKEQDNLMRSQLNQGTALSESALKAQQQYWQRLIDDPKTAKESLEGYRRELKRTIDLQQQQADSNRDRMAARLNHPGQFANFSESELRQSIEAGKQLLQTYKSGSAEAERLAKNILAAENHIKNFGLDAQRAAQKEAQAVAEAARKRKEADTTMRKQLYNTKDLTESALKSQEQYWKRLIDDPNTAAGSLSRYRKDLEQVRRLQQQMEQQRGQDAYDFFKNGDYKNASADEIKKQSEALKKYRDSLPQKDNADTIKEINSLLVKTGAAAQKSADQAMTMKQALRIGLDAKNGNFRGTTEQLLQAKKALEQLQQSAVKGGLAWRRMQDGIDSINLELKRTGYLSEEVRKVLDKPKGRSLNALKQAVEQGRAALQNMDRTTVEGQKVFDGLAKKIKETELELKKMSGEAKATASSFDKAWSRLKTYIGLYVSAAVAMQKLTATMGDLMELSDKMGEVQKTTAFTAEEVGHLTNELRKMDTRTTITGLLDLSVAAGQLGLKTQEDVLGFTKAANKLMVALPEMGKEGATEMLKVALATGEIDKIRKQMEQGLIDGSSATAVAMEKVGSTIDRLRATSAATAPAITDFVKRVGAVGAQSGITIDQVAALGSTVDALGMRVEMSATALSRMIPAIKNNAFALAQAIGVTPDTIRSLFDAGRGMEVVLMVLQRIKDSGMDADSIENMLGMAGMKDIMKDLNQQGARAGIVFAGLSQNVDTLRKHLVTAREAYEENKAITNEYIKMNETTAARWERLKNQIEETFVSDSSQRFLGKIIDGLRQLVDLLTGSSGVSVALQTILIYLGLVRLRLISIAAGALTKVGAGLKNIGIMLGFIKGEMTKLQWSNILTAAAGAVLYLATTFRDAARAVSAVSKAMGDIEKEMRKEMAAADMLFRSLAKAREQERLAAVSSRELADSADNLTKSTQMTAEAQGQLASKEKEVAEQAGKVEDGMHRVNVEGSKSASIIREINSKYSTYLGYMLSETSSAEQLAKARELINAKLRETITLKQQEAAMGNVEQEYGGNVNKKASAMDKFIQSQFGDNYDAAARASVAISEAAQKYARDPKEFEKAVKDIMSKISLTADSKQVKQIGSSRVANQAVDRFLNLADDYRKAVEEYQDQTDVVNRRFDATMNVNRKTSREAIAKDLNAILGDWKDLVSQYQKAEGEEKEKLAAAVYKQQRAYANAVANNAEYFAQDKRMNAFEKNIKNMATWEKGLRDVAGEAIRTIDAMERAETKVTNLDFTNNGNSTNNPWGSPLSGESTDWKNMTAEQLVNRRKQMNQFVNAIQTDTDVQSVLNEDTALKKAIEKGMASDMRTVIEWYNTERLKIQDELHARHLTNTGDWMDPKKEKARKKQFESELIAYLDELDAYYTERKTRIQEAGTEEGITKAEVRNRTLANEMEWRQRRAELQKLYADKSAEVTAEEQDAIFDIIAERTGDSSKFIEKTIRKTVQFSHQVRDMNEQGAKEYRKWMGKLGLGWERDFLKQQQALAQQMKAIQDIIDKERPFNGITKNLRENLVTMGILTADMSKERDELMRKGEDMADFNARQAAEELRRTAFMLGEAEGVYSSTVEDVMRRMADAGLEAWADELRRNPKMQEGMMAQLRSTYDAIQEAIKKEATLIKKQTDIWWNDLAPGQQQSRKGGFEKMLSQLGLQEDQVKRANQLIGAGQASERVADKLAIKQMQIRLQMQETYYRRMRQIGAERIAQLRAAGKYGDAEHLQRSLNLALSEEQKKLDEQRVAIANQLEESQNRLYRSLKEWGDLLAGGVQSVMEASNAGLPEYYNERAKLNLTGKGGPGAGTYVVIDDAGTSDAKAHYEHLDERAALEREREIERENAMADAWKKVMDDLNMKMSEQITDWMNAALQNQSIDANTDATLQNTEALAGLTSAIAGGSNGIAAYGTGDAGWAVGAGGAVVQNEALSPEGVQEWTDALSTEPWLVWEQAGKSAMQDVQKATEDASKKMTASTQSSFAKMTAAANLYGIAYQTMSNDNLSASQKAQMMAVQAAGNAAIAMLTTDLAAGQAKNSVQLPGILGKLLGEMPYPAAIATFAIVTGLLGGLMGLAVSKIAKSKSEIAQATGAGANAGKLTTGMLTYAEGNVNEFTDPSTLTPGRSYNVDAADGRTYRAKYTGRNPRTHLTSGPEFHLSGEKGRELIIDAGTTRQITMNDSEVWHAIQTLSAGRKPLRRRHAGRGVAAFADGNIEDFEELAGSAGTDAYGMDGSQMAAFQSSLEKNNELLERALTEGIRGVFNVHGPEGLVSSYDKGKREALRHGERYP